MGKIIRNGVSYGGSSNAAGNISYDNSTSGLNSTTVQNAITELKRMIGGNNLQQYTTLPAPTSELEGTIVEYVGGTTINYTHGFIYECKEDSSNPGTYIWEGIPVQEDTLIIEDVSELPTAGHIESHFYRVNSNEEDAEITVPSECDTVEKLKNYFLNNLPLEVASESTNLCHLKQKDGEPLRYCHTDGGTSFYLKDIDIHYNTETEHLKVNISYGDMSRDNFTDNEIYTTYYFTTVDTDYYIGDEANQCFSKINTSEEVVEGVGRFERDGQGNILGEYFNQYEDDTSGSTTVPRNSATGHYSSVRGFGNSSSADYSSVEGSGNVLNGGCTGGHIEGLSNSANIGSATIHMEGYTNTADQGNMYSHVEGANNVIYNGVSYSHIEGSGNASGTNTSSGSGLSYMHIEGRNNTGFAGSTVTHVEGYSNALTISPSNYSHIEGQTNTVSNQNTAHVEGQSNTLKQATGVSGNNNNNHVEGNNNMVVGVEASHIEGNNIVYGTTGSNQSHIEGQGNVIGSDSTPVIISQVHVEGGSNQIKPGVSVAQQVHIEGLGNSIENRGSGSTTSVTATHIEGYNNKADAYYTHVEGSSNIANHGILNAHIEGQGNTASNSTSHTEGSGNTNNAVIGHAEGSNNTLTLEGSNSHVEGYGNTMNASVSHIEGNNNTVNAAYGHAEGSYNTIGGQAEAAHVGGYNNINDTSYQTAIGRYNKSDKTLGSNVLTSAIEVEDDTILNTENGTTTTFSGVGTTDFIAIPRSMGFKIHMGEMVNVNKVYICYYDENKNFLVCDQLNDSSSTVDTYWAFSGDGSERGPRTGGGYYDYYDRAKYCRISGDISSSSWNNATLQFWSERNLVTIGNGYLDHSTVSAGEVVRSNIVEIGDDNVRIYGDTKLRGTIEQEATCKATGDYSNALGTGTIAETNNSTVIGQYNIPDSTMSAQNMFDGTINEGAYSTTTDPTDATFYYYAVEMPDPERNIQTTSRLAIDNNTSLTITAPAGRPVFIPGVTPAGDYCVIVCFFDYVGTLIKKEVYYETNKGDLVTHTFTSSYLKTAGAYKVAVCCQLDDQYVDSLSITQTIENLFVIGNGIDNSHRSNIITVSPSETIINNDITLTGNIVITGTIANKTIKSSNSYYGGHMRKDGECPFRYRRMLYFGNYTGDETPKIIVDNTDPQNPVPYQPGYYSLELESYAGLPKAVMKMIENSIYSPDGDFKANMRHIVSYYCALLQHNVKSRIEITSITASSNTFTQDGETYHFPLVNYVILPPWDGSSGTYTGAAILDIVFNNFQA